MAVNNNTKFHILRITIVRHGETTANAAGVIQGQSMDPSFKLTELGISQAKTAGRALAGKSWWKVFSSDLPRTRETAHYLFEHETEDPRGSLETRWIEYTSLIRECSAGIREGKPKHIDVDELVAEYVAEHGTHNEVPLGETRAQVIQRGEEFLKHLVQGAMEVYDGSMSREVLMVTHGGFIQMFLKSVCGVKGVNMVNNTSFSSVDVYVDKLQPPYPRQCINFEPVLINDTRHLTLDDASLMSASKW